MAAMESHGAQSSTVGYAFEACPHIHNIHNVTSFTGCVWNVNLALSVGDEFVAIITMPSGDLPHTKKC